MAQKKRTTTGAGASSPAPSPIAKLANSVKLALGKEAATTYQGRPATVKRVTLRLPDEDSKRASQWWQVEGLCGQVVEALELIWTPPGAAHPEKRYIYDGDGTGTLKFLDRGGEGSLPYRECPGSTIVDGGAGGSSGGVTVTVVEPDEPAQEGV